MEQFIEIPKITKEMVINIRFYYKDDKNEFTILNYSQTLSMMNADEDVYNSINDDVDQQKYAMTLASKFASMVPKDTLKYVNMEYNTEIRDVA